jgi:hypothetical protein
MIGPCAWRWYGAVSGSLLALCVALPVGAAEQTSQPADVLEYGSGTSKPRLRHVGLMFDIGTLDGGMLSLVYRPLPSLRLHGGGGTNSASPGFRAGATWLPFGAGSSISLDGGHFFEGDVNGIVRAVSDYSGSSVLERFDYSFANLQAGIEVDKGDLLFFARGGVAYVWSQIPEDEVASANRGFANISPDGSLWFFMPSLKVGFIGFL